MKNTPKAKRPASAESIARLADKGKDVSAYFTNKGRMMPPLNIITLTLNDQTLMELNKAARIQKVSGQTLIKQFIKSGLEKHSSIQRTRKTG